METITNIGSTIPLTIQLSDGDRSLPLVAKAVVYDDQNNKLTEVNLTHLEGGLFIHHYVMPDFPFILVHYHIYEDDGVTDAGYSRGMDIFRNALMLEFSEPEIITQIVPVEQEFIVELDNASN